MNAVLAFLLFVGVGAIAVVHALWGLGSTWPEANQEALARGVVGDGRKRMPPPWQCFAVAALLAGDVDIVGSETLGAGAEAKAVIEAAAAGKIQAENIASATWEHIDFNLFVR